MSKVPFALFLYSLLFSVSGTFGQSNTSLSGTLVNEHLKPVAFIKLALKKNNRKTATDRNGVFIFRDLSAGSDTLVISGAGFQYFLVPVDIKENTDNSLGQIRLNNEIAQLPGVEIIGHANRSYKSDYSYAATKMQTQLKDIPQAVSGITRELMSDKMQFHLNEVTADAAGINLYSGNDEYTIRGFKAENAHLINGLRTFNAALISPMLVNIDRVEIIKGPTSVLYGNSDPGGNINMVTKKPLQTEMTEVDIWLGSYSAVRAQADITGPMNQSKKWLYRFNTGYENTGSFRNGIFNKSFEIAPSFSYIPNQKLQFNADFFVQHTDTKADRGQPGILNNNKLDNTALSLSVVQPDDYLRETDASAILSLTYRVHPNLTFNSAALAYFADQQLAEHGVRGYITPDSVSLYYMQRKFNNFTLTLNNYATFTFNTGVVSHRLLTGYDLVSGSGKMNIFNGEIPSLFGAGSGVVGTFSLLHPEYISRGVANYKESTVQNNTLEGGEYTAHGFYLQEQAGYRNWQLLIGIREELYSSGDEKDAEPVSSVNVFLPRIGLVYKVNPSLSFYGTYNKGFDPYEAGLTQQVFKEAFKPLYSELLEAGLKTDLFRNRVAANLAIYRLRVQNIAVSANDPANPDLYVQRGMDQAVGVEGELSGNILPNLSLSVSYAWNVAKIKEGASPAEINTIKENAPRFSGSSWLKYSLNKGLLKGFYLSAGHYQQTSRNTLTSGMTLPGYVTLQAGAGYTRKRMKLALNVNNLFNTAYWVGGYNYASKWPGAPRNLMVNLEYFFK